MIICYIVGSWGVDHDGVGSGIVVIVGRVSCHCERALESLICSRIGAKLALGWRLGKGRTNEVMMELVGDRLIDWLIAIAMLALALHFGSRYLVFIEEGKRGGEVLSLLS